ncbi:phage minor tail protein L [Sulfuriferula sp.]|uniref:phage minor tail protein L n=1 Tax=Sulfuriferula sp. TaxID=2025307 RepID=UPI00273134A1|nr:phage minor tail protein L [Sulfuriferula sp.]MDP2026454.1 phage minor tail protein L [Sulfuriferula sp.]
MTIASDIQLPAPGSLIALYQLDLTALGGAVLYFHPGVNSLLSQVVWQGISYAPLPMQIEGFDLSGTGKLPRPKVRISNATGLVGTYCKSYADLIGAKLTRKRTFVKYLDAVNFPGGVNLTADPNVGFADDVFFVDRKSLENKTMVEFELAAAFDLQGVLLPRRQFIQNVCPWRYRSAECGFAGGAVALADDTPTATLALDVCGKRLSSCKLRFGANNPLPFGGFPATGLIQ